MQIPLYRKLLSEVYSTGFMVFVGNAASAQQLFTNGSTTDLQLGWGFAITFAIYSAYNVSGGHINPSISIASFILKKLSFLHFILYFVAQTIGAAVGSLATYAVYKEALDHFDGGLRTLTGDKGSASFWISYPGEHVSNWGAFIDQVAGTSFLGMFVAMVSCDNCPIPKRAVPLLFGLNAVMLGSAFGMNVGCPLNPARDLGPRIVASFLGYGSDMFTHHNYYFWVPLVAPLIGSIIGVVVYNCMVMDTSQHQTTNYEFTSNPKTTLCSKCRHNVERLEEFKEFL